MTPNDIRVRLAAVLAQRQAPEDIDCLHCGGTGRVSRRAKVATQADAARYIGVSRTQVANFVIGRTDLSLPVGLRLLDWLDQQEARAATRPTEEARND